MQCGIIKDEDYDNDDNNDNDNNWITPGKYNFIIQIFYYIF